MNLFFCGIYEQNVFAAVKEIHKLRFQSTITSAATKITVTQTELPLKDKEVLGSAYRGEVDLDSDVNHLASGNLRKYTTVTSQCERLP